MEQIVDIVTTRRIAFDKVLFMKGDKNQKVFKIFIAVVSSFENLLKSFLFQRLIVFFMDKGVCRTSVHSYGSYYHLNSKI